VSEPVYWLIQNEPDPVPVVIHGATTDQQAAEWAERYQADQCEGYWRNGQPWENAPLLRDGYTLLRVVAIVPGTDT
jgi:hypothetical protein